MRHKKEILRKLWHLTEMIKRNGERLYDDAEVYSWEPTESIHLEVGIYASAAHLYAARKLDNNLFEPLVMIDFTKRKVLGRWNGEEIIRELCR